MAAVEITPILNVSDWNASAEWFCKIGFRRGFEWSSGPGSGTTFGSVIWDTAEIFLCLDAQGGRGQHGMWMSIFVDDLDTVYARCVREGIDITREPIDEVWGVREFHVRHPDGHVLRIGKGDEPEP
jgi:hypothetical protein